MKTWIWIGSGVGKDAKSRLINKKYRMETGKLKGWILHIERNKTHDYWLTCHQRGYLHNKRGPAVIVEDSHVSWYRHGKFLFMKDA